MATIAQITGYRVRHYNDNGQTIAYCDWIDSRGTPGTTGGSPSNAHMLALRARAETEGVTVESGTSYREGC